MPAEILLEYLTETPLDRNELFLAASEADIWLDSRPEFDDLIDDLIAQGRLMETETALVVVETPIGPCYDYIGTVRFENRKPIVDLDNGDDMELPTDSAASLIAGDRIQVRMTTSGAVIGVTLVTPRSGHIVGIAGAGFLAPLRERLGGKCYLLPGQHDYIPDGSLVLARLDGRCQDGVNVEPVMVQPAPTAPENAFGAICTEFGLDTQDIVPTPEIIGADKEDTSRRDLTDYPFVTIDGEDSKDFDDAICVSRTDGGFRLLVAVADVSYYVHPGSILDAHALLRATSVYFPGRCIPMLPELLSNDLCSLVEGQSRLVMVADMLVENDGMISSAQFYNATITSKLRLTYNTVEDFFRKRTAAPLPTDIAAMLSVARKCAKKIRKHQAGTTRKIEFDTGPRMESQRLIEEFMLAANRQVAGFLAGHPLTCGNVFLRKHDAPTPENTGRAAFQARIAGISASYEEFAGLIPSLAQHTDRAVRSIVSEIMRRAKYVVSDGNTNSAHYALDEHYYTHFTSPIRRYPDIIVHRLLKTALGINQWEPPHPWLKQTAEWCSHRAETAARAEAAIKKRAALQELLDNGITTAQGTVIGSRYGNCLVKLEEHSVVGVIKKHYLPEGKTLLVSIKKLDITTRQLVLTNLPERQASLFGRRGGQAEVC